MKGLRFKKQTTIFLFQGEFYSMTMHLKKYQLIDGLRWIGFIKPKFRFYQEV